MRNISAKIGCSPQSVPNDRALWSRGFHRTTLALVDPETGCIKNSRVEGNEEFMWHSPNRQLDELFLGDGECENTANYSKAVATAVIAEPLGVPEEEDPQAAPQR